jgi:mevalonate kinase
MNHLLVSSLGVGHAVLDKVRWMASTYELSCKLTGAGGGGCAIIHLPSDTRTETRAEIVGDLEREGFSCYFIEAGGQGVTFEE